MFQGCTSLTTAPTMNVQSVAEYSCYWMFYMCTNLSTVKSNVTLAATTLAANCYNRMFYKCSNMSESPDLPALTLVYRCYWGMFDSCTRLYKVKALFTTTPGTDYTDNWLYGVASSGTFTKNSSATWNVRGASGIPNNWAITW